MINLKAIAVAVAIGLVAAIAGTIVGDFTKPTIRTTSDIRVIAMVHEDGAVEMGIMQDGRRILPSHRWISANPSVGIWLHSGKIGFSNEINPDQPVAGFVPVTLDVDGHRIRIAPERQGGFDRRFYRFNSGAARKALGCRSFEDASHIVALSEAHESGAHFWNNNKKRAFANDLANLRCVRARENRSRGERDLAEYSRGSLAYRCLIDEIAPWIKKKYDLKMDLEEANAHIALDCTEPE